MWLRDAKQPEIEFLEDEIGLPGIEIKLEHLAELSDSEEDNDPEKPTDDILKEVAEDLKLCMERTASKMEHPDENEEDTTEHDTPLNRKKSHTKREQKTNDVDQKSEKFDMKEIHQSTS